MTTEILFSEEAIEVAKHLLWHQQMFRECPVQVKGIKPELAEIFEREFMECLKREVQKSYDLV